MSRPARRFWFVLALALGATVGELQARMGAREFSEWQALYQLDPFGDVRSDFQAGQVASTVVNLFREKDDPMVSPAAFILPTPWLDPTLSTKVRQPQKARQIFEPGSAEEDKEVLRMFGAVPKEDPAPGSHDETKAFLDAMGATRRPKA